MRVKVKISYISLGGGVKGCAPGFHTIRYISIQRASRVKTR